MLGQLRAAVCRVGAVGPAVPLRIVQLLQHNITCPSLQLQQVRTAVGGFNASSAQDLWKSITVVSKNGARRGRGKRVNARLIKDLYKDQKMGDGKVKMVWPGLNNPILRGRQVVQQERLPAQEVTEVPDQVTKQVVQNVRRIHPLDRGFTSVNICGRNLKNTTQLLFSEEFDYRVLDARSVSHMTGQIGRCQSAATVVACGNGDGLIGLGAGKATNRIPSVQKAANKAIMRLLYIERCNNHTVLHNFFSQYYATKIFVSRKPEGYGLDCHRVIALICKLVGIKDIEAKVEGSTMPINIAKAFVLGLVRQKKYDDFAEEKRLHVVEIDPRRRNFPSVLASPTVCRKTAEIPTSESLDFNQHALDGRVRYIKPQQPPFYTKLPGWQIHLKKSEKLRSSRKSMYHLMARYGELRSFLAEKYPEARVKIFQKQ